MALSFYADHNLNWQGKMNDQIDHYLSCIALCYDCLSTFGQITYLKKFKQHGLDVLNLWFCSRLPVQQGHKLFRNKAMDALHCLNRGFKVKFNESYQQNNNSKGLSKFSVTRFGIWAKKNINLSELT